MIRGGLDTPRANYTPVWIPKAPQYDYSRSFPAKFDFWKVVKAVLKHGGIFLGKPDPITLYKESEPVTWYCKSCNILITDLNDMVRVYSKIQ